MRHFALGSVLLLASAQLALTATLEVIVGGPGVLKFNPPSVNANVGDVVRFIFQQKNHTVTQSTLANPCTPLAGGFDSGFMPVPENRTTGFPQADLPVRQAAPIWAYCRQGPHCRSGMVFAVNPGNDLAAFQAAATGGTPSSSLPPTVSSTSAAVPTSSGTPSSTDHKVIVGGSGLVFNPSNISALPGDTITFEFRQKNHTVTASSFDEPCRDLLSSTGQPGFDSGYKPVADGTSSFPTYVLQVNDTKPIWAFCKQGNHCNQGMVFAVNPVESSKSFAAFQALAKQSTTGTTSTNPYPSSAWRPAVGSSSIAVILSLSAAAFLL